MDVVIRTDIGGEYGLGHGTRMLALAQELTKRDAEVVFVTKTHELQAFISPYPCFLQGEQPVPHADVLLYDTTEPLMTGLLDIYSSYTNSQLVCIDRLDAPTSAALCILPNLHTSPSMLTSLRIGFGPRLLAGAEVVMLPQEVSALPPIPYADRVDGSIVFCAGGSDPGHVLDRLFGWFSDCLPDVEKYFCIGAYSGWHCLNGISTTKTYVVLFNRDLLRQAALVVTTMGVIAYECLYWGTPVLVVGHTDRHCAAAQQLGDGQHLIGYMGDIRRMTQAQLTAQLYDWWQYQTWRERLAGTSAGVLDGRGVERVADAVMGLA